MDVFSIITQPNAYPDFDSVLSNYRQIRFEVLADSFVPADQPMYCDIYIASVFYKTISAYTISTLSPSGNSLFIFDIQDALQEAALAFINLTATSVAMVQSSDNAQYNMLLVQCYFRGSAITSGLLVPNPVVPIQGTATTAPVSGTGTPSNIFYVLNSSIVPEFRDIFSNALETLLAQKKNNLIVTGNYRAYSLSNIPSLNYTHTYLNTDVAKSVYATDNGQFPVLIMLFAASGILDLYSRNCQLWITYFNSDFSISNVVSLTTGAVVLQAGFTYYIPCGLADIAILNPTIYNLLINAKERMYYYLTIRDMDAPGFVWSSPLFYANNTPSVTLYPNEGELTNLWFQNLYGNFEQLSFVRTAVTTKAKSSSQLVPYDQQNIDSFIPNSWLLKGVQRYNVRGYDELSITLVIPEPLLPWLRELLLSPFVWQQYSGATTSFRAMSIIDSDLETKKSIKGNNQIYEVTITLKPSVDPIMLRN
jgi:hypothetical protein